MGERPFAQPILLNKKLNYFWQQQNRTNLSQAIKQAAKIRQENNKKR